MAKGIGVISGSSDVVFSVCEDGRIVMGGDVPVSASLSGTLVLELEGTQGDGKFLRSDAVGSSSWATVSASEVTVTPFLDVTSSDVQGALEELRGDIQAAAGSGSFSVSDGGNTEGIPTDGTQTLTWQGTANQITSSYDPGTNTFTFALADDVVIPNNLTVTNDLIVNGTSSFLNVENLFVEDPLITLASGNIAQTLDQGLIMTRSGSNYGMIWDESEDKFKFIETNEDGTTAGNISIIGLADLCVRTIDAETGSFQGDVTIGGDLTVTGNLNLTNISAEEITASQGVAITGGGLEVTGNVNLPDGAINNNELENDSIRVDLGFGLTSSLGDPFDVPLGGTASFAVLTGSGGLAAADTTITISGTVNEVNVDGGLSTTIDLGTGGTITVGLPDDVEIAGDLFVTGNLEVTGNTTLGTDSSDLTTVNSQFRMPVFTTGSIPAAYTSSPENFVGHMFYLTGSGLASGEYFRQGNKVYFNENGDWYPSPFFAC